MKHPDRPSVVPDGPGFCGSCRGSAGRGCRRCWHRALCGGSGFAWAEGVGWRWSLGKRLRSKEPEVFFGPGRTGSDRVLIDERRGERSSPLLSASNGGSGLGIASPLLCLGIGIRRWSNCVDGEEKSAQRIPPVPEIVVSRGKQISPASWSRRDVAAPTSIFQIGNPQNHVIPFSKEGLQQFDFFNNETSRPRSTYNPTCLRLRSRHFRA